VLFQLPVRPGIILAGKNLAIGVLALLEAVVLGAILAGVSGGWGLLPVALVGTVAGVLIALGVGNVVSVLLPAPMPEGSRATYGAGPGCLRGLLQMVAFLVIWAMLLPVAAAAAVPWWLQHPEWWWLTLPAALLYAVAIYAVALTAVGPLLQERQPEILAIVTRE
jgi:hypothetical protein